MVFSRSVRMHRARRLISSGSPVLLAGGLALAGLAVSSISKGLDLNRAAVWVLLAVWAALMLFQMNAEYRKRTYDPTLLLRFTDEFHGEEMEGMRCEASRFLKTNVGRPAGEASSELSKLFDFFDQVGFLLQGDQFTAESAHHAFHHWIRGYWSAARDYASAAQAKDPSLWEFVEVVFDMTDQIEKERVKNKPKRFLDEAGIEKFLDEEIEATCNADTEEPEPEETRQ
jgi:hypothetical protein